MEQQLVRRDAEPQPTQQQEDTVSNNIKNSPAESFLKESSIPTLVKDYGWITFAAVIAAIAVNFFFTLTELVPGGATGLSLACSTVFGIPVSTMSLCISISLLTLSTIALGKNFGIKTLYITLAISLFMKLIPFIHTTQSLLDIHPFLELAVAGLLGGLLVEAAIGIALNHACAIGGTDVIVLLTQHIFKFPKVSVVLFFLDGSVVIASSVITQNILIFVFSFLSLMVII